ncbi:MAG: PilZ domain-containing protein [Spirochaetaceae bacterium]|jgi:hypothetical protein|nr:PilZ domain-containing protein [Spirochaetaceae bacterium]
MYLNLFFLQGLNKFQIQTNPLQVVVTLFVFICIVALIIYLNTSKKAKNSVIINSGRLDIEKFTHPVSKEFAKIAKEYGLSKQEAEFLEKAFKDCEMSPVEVFQDKKEMDLCFSSVYKYIKRESENPEEELKKLDLFFSARNTIEFKHEILNAANSKKNVKPRRFKRRKASIQCSFCEIIEKEIKSGVKTIKKLTPSNKKSNGDISDISLGGCAILVKESFKPGVKIKIEFKVAGVTVAALGVILRINKNASESIMHVKFIQIPPRSLQNLNAFIFDYMD